MSSIKLVPMGKPDMRMYLVSSKVTYLVHQDPNMYSHWVYNTEAMTFSLVFKKLSEAFHLFVKLNKSHEY